MDAILAIFRIAIIATIVVTGIFSSVFEGMYSLGLVEVLDRPNSCFRIFSLKIFRGPRTHVFVKYFAVLGLCCACGGPLTNWNSVDTGTQTMFGFRGDVFTRTCWTFRYALCKIFRGPRTMLRLWRAAYKLELYGHRDSNLVRFSRGCVH